MVHVVPLPKLPSAKETAEVMLSHVFRLHGLPQDVVSDRGPQFASRFWKEFCRLIGATTSLSSSSALQSWPKCLAVHPGPSSPPGVPQVGIQICWSVPHQKGGKPCGGAAQAPQDNEGPSDLPCFQGQAHQDQSTGFLLQTPSNLPGHWWGGQHTQLGAFWQSAAGAVDFNTSWTGRVTGPRRGPGSLLGTFMVKLWLRISTGVTRTNRGLLEPSLEGEVL